MKRLKWLFVIMCISVLFACAGAFAACGDSPDSQYFTVTVAPYQAEQGEVEISAPANGKSYAKNESVTVTVTPAENYEVAQVEVNDRAVSLKNGKYTFKVTGDTVISATFEFVGWRSIAWNEATLGVLTFDEDYNMTLTKGETVQAVTVLTAGVDLSEGFPAGEIDVTVGTGAGVKAYKVLFGTFLVFKEGYTQYVFDSAPHTDFSAYTGTWKQYGGETQLIVTASGFVYDGNTYGEYYTAFDGSHYVKSTPAVGAARRYLFGYRDSAQSVFFFDYMNNNVRHFTADGNLPTVTIPAEFYGAWRNETYYDLDISVDGGMINKSVAIQAFAVMGSGEEAIVHLYYNSLYWTMYQTVDPDTGEKAIAMNNGTISYVFSAVKPEPLPAEYRNEWLPLGGTDTISVDNTGKFTYNGSVYDTIRDSHDLGFHFTNAQGKDALIVVSSDGFALWIVTDTNVSYFTRGEVTSLPDLTASGLGGTWTAAGKRLTVLGGHFSIAEGGVTKRVQLLTWAQESGEEAGFIGTALYDNIWWDIKYVIATRTITFTTNNTTLVFIAG